MVRLSVPRDGPEADGISVSEHRMHVLAYLGVPNLEAIRSSSSSLYVEPMEMRALTHVPFEERSAMMISPLNFLSISQWRAPMKQSS